MSTVVSDILTGIKAIIVDELGADYRELPFSLDVAKNRFQGGTKAYAVWALDMFQSDSVTHAVTVDHTFNVVLTESFGSSQVGDSAQRVAGLALFNRFQEVYLRIVAEKAQVPSQVMIVQRLVTQPIQFIDSNVAVFRAAFDIKYRKVRGP